MSVGVSLPRVWFLSVLANFGLWLVPLLFGKYSDSWFPYIVAEDIGKELVGSNDNEALRCPMIPTGLLGVNTLHSTEVTSQPQADIITKYGIQPGGVWQPNTCKARYHVAIVIPYRNREHHLQQFLTYMHPFLTKQQLSYRIVVVEQLEGDPFNRGKLFNVGFVETLKLDPLDCFIFHDIDLLPQNDMNMYACTRNPRHMYSSVDIFRYQLPYRTLFGGAIAISKDHFQQVNGFSNQFYGWGGEDDDMYTRVVRAGLTVVRFDPSIASYLMLPHISITPSENRFQLLKENWNSTKNNGLSTLSYEVVDKGLSPLYTWFKVSV